MAKPRGRQKEAASKSMLSRLASLLVFLVTLKWVAHFRIVTQEARRLTGLLLHGTKTWVYMLGRLLIYVVIMMPGWFDMLRYWLFDDKILLAVIPKGKVPIFAPKDDTKIGPEDQLLLIARSHAHTGTKPSVWGCSWNSGDKSQRDDDLGDQRLRHSRRRSSTSKNSVKSAQIQPEIKYPKITAEEKSSCDDVVVPFSTEENMKSSRARPTAINTSLNAYDQEIA